MDLQPRNYLLPIKSPLSLILVASFGRKATLVAVPMKLLLLVNELPLWLTTLIVVAAAEIFSIGLLLGCRAAFGLSRLSLNNEVAGFNFAVVGLFYGVLLAFVVIAVWEDYRNTETAVRNEAKAVADLYRMSFALPEQDASAIREHLFSYADQVRQAEWSTMARGQASKAVADELGLLSEAIFNVRPQDMNDQAIYQQALKLLTIITDNRNERLDSADGTAPAILWLVLLIGGLITLAYPAFFGAANLIAQILMTAALAALVALSMLLAAVFDFPFSGDVKVSASPFDAVIQDMVPLPQ
jgi:hypothetical protein